MNTFCRCGRAAVTTAGTCGRYECMQLPPPSGETVAEEIARLQREIGERQLRLQRLVLGDPTKSVSGHVFPANGVA